MPLRIPDAHKKTVAQIAGLPDEVVERIAAALKDAPPAISPRAMARSIAEQVQLPVGEVSAILAVLSALVYTKNHHKYDVVSVATEVAAEAAREGLEGVESGSGGQAQLRRRLVSLLSEPGALEITGKAAQVYFAHGTLYQSSRVFSDVRPIFREDEPRKPVVGTIVHNLQLTLYRGGRREYEYVALNIHDLKQLRGVVDRAIEKDAALKQLITESGMTYMEDSPPEDQR